MSTDERAARLRAESRASAADTGAAIARKHVQYLSDLMGIVRVLSATLPADEVRTELWTAYVREILTGMHVQLGAATTSTVLMAIAREIEDEIRAGVPHAH